MEEKLTTLEVVENRDLSADGKARKILRAVTAENLYFLQISLSRKRHVQQRR